LQSAASQMSDSATPAPAPQGQKPDLAKTLAEVLQEANPEVLKEIPPEELAKVQSMVLRQERTHIMRAGPLPPPAELAAYNAIIPDGADRIMKMAEAQSAHRINLEKTVVCGQQAQEKMGQICGLIIGLAGLGLATYAAISGQPWFGAVIGGSTLVSLVSVFLYSKHVENKELSEKKKEMESVTPQEPSQPKQKNR